MSELSHQESHSGAAKKNKLTMVKWLGGGRRKGKD